MTFLFSFSDFGAIVLIILCIIVFRFILTLFYGGVSKITGKTIPHRGDTWAKPYNETDKMMNASSMGKANQLLPELPKIPEYLSEEEKERRQGLMPSAFMRRNKGQINLTPLPFQKTSILSFEGDNQKTDLIKNIIIENKSDVEKVNENQKQNHKNDVLDIPKIDTISFKEYFQKSLIEGNIELMKFLVNNFSDGCLVNKDGNTPIHLSNNKQIVDMFINGGENVNVKNLLGLTPLQMNDNPEIINFLIDKGANVNSTGLLGTTALHIAILNGNFTVAKILISNGADILIKNQDGLTPVTLAIYKGENRILNLFPIQNQYQTKVERLPDNFNEEIISLLTNQITQGIEELVKRSLADDPFKNTRLEKMFVYGQFHNAVTLYKENIIEKKELLQMSEVDINSLIEATSIQVLKHCISVNSA